MASTLHGTGLAYRDPSVRLEGFRADGAVTVNPAGVDANGLRLNGNYVTDLGSTPMEAIIATVTLRGKDLQLRNIALSVFGGHFHGDGKVLNLVRYSVTYCQTLLGQLCTSFLHLQYMIVLSSVICFLETTRLVEDSLTVLSR